MPTTSPANLHSALGRPLTTPALGRFYKRNGYKGRIQPDDHCLWLSMDEQIIAAARLNPLPSPNGSDGSDGLLLRGFWVAKGLRNRGIGQHLLKLLIAHVDTIATKRNQPVHALYCFAYPHLCDFYRKQGFQPVQDTTSIPDALKRKQYAYAKQPEPPCLMHLQTKATPAT